LVIDVSAFATTYAILWHLTIEPNLQGIERTQTLESAVALVRAAGNERWLRRRRPAAQALTIGAEMVAQRPGSLDEGAIQLGGGWTFERVVEEINRRVYFWPGTAGPLPRGRARTARRSAVRQRLARAERKAGLPKLAGSLWHAYRRKQATERKHHPIKDVAAAEGWKSTQTLLTCYQQADQDTVRRVL